MVKILRKLLAALWLLGVVYTAGLLIGLFFCVLRISGRLKVTHWERFPKWHRGILAISNHPSLYDPILIMGLWFSQYLFHPFLFSPYNTPDQSNYRFLAGWMKPRMIFIPRGQKRKEWKILRYIAAILRTGGIVILFPEGGRTSSVPKKQRILSQNGCEMRPLKRGAATVASRTGAIVLPIWIDGSGIFFPNNGGVISTYLTVPRFWKRRVVIRIGEPFRLDGSQDHDQANKKLQDALLKLADEEG